MRLTASRIGVILLILTFITSQAVGVAAASSGAAVTTDPSGDTLVQTDHGEHPISEIKVGDKVLAYDEATGKTGYFAVTALISNLDFTVQDLTIDGEQIETTAGHPFYTQERGWVKAADLKVGEHVRKADGSYGVVKVDHAQMQVQRMYNLTVDKAHTFFVGGQQWLVHNSEPCNLERLAQEKAAQIREDAANLSNNQKKKLFSRKVTVVQDRVSGEISYGVTGEITSPDAVPFELPSETLASHGQDPWHCAEVAACTKAILKGAKLENLDMWTVDIGAGDPAIRCANCKTWSGAINVLSEK